MLPKVFLLLRENYTKMNPHHETWELWIKREKTPKEFYEVVIGTILVQNTNWGNVSRAISELEKMGLFSFQSIVDNDQRYLEEAVRFAGFYKQKSEYIINLSRFLISQGSKTPSRESLLKIKGIGKETADSILEFCYGQSIPIVGTYTRRFLARFLGKAEFLTKNYEIVQKYIGSAFNQDFKEFGKLHALIVVHSQNVCQKNKPKCPTCFLKTKCVYFMKKEEDNIVANIQKQILKKKNSE
ncbi:hypothetical protein [Candidatus Hodarchaeum mangrovi]